MGEDFKNFFLYLKSAEPPVGLFDRIIFAIKKEQKLQNTRKLLFSFFSLLILSFITIPLSWSLLVQQINSSGISYFVSTAFSDLSIFAIFWQDFSLAILESLPVIGIIAFTISTCIALFTLRLFLYKKRLLFDYLIHNVV